MSGPNFKKIYPYWTNNTAAPHRFLLSNDCVQLYHISIMVCYSEILKALHFHPSTLYLVVLLVNTNTITLLKFYWFQWKIFKLISPTGIMVLGNAYIALTQDFHLAQIQLSLTSPPMTCTQMDYDFKWSVASSSRYPALGRKKSRDSCLCCYLLFGVGEHLVPSHG